MTKLAYFDNIQFKSNNFDWEEEGNKVYLNTIRRNTTLEDGGNWPVGNYFREMEGLSFIPSKCRHMRWPNEYIGERKYNIMILRWCMKYPNGYMVEFDDNFWPIRAWEPTKNELRLFKMKCLGG